MRPRHVLYFIQFLFPSIAFCASEELVVLNHSLAFCLHLAARDYGVFQTSALEMKNEGLDKSF